LRLGLFGKHRNSLRLAGKRVERRLRLSDVVGPVCRVKRIAGVAHTSGRCWSGGRRRHLHEFPRVGDAAAWCHNGRGHNGKRGDDRPCRRSALLHWRFPKEAADAIDEPPSRCIEREHGLKSSQFFELSEGRRVRHPIASGLHHHVVAAAFTFDSNLT
jgi:hypothetical protein